MVTMIWAAVNDADLLQRADKMLRSGDKTEIFRAYNDYKNIYLRAMMKDDDRLRKKALDGIVTSGNLLHIDVSRYEQERGVSRPRKSREPDASAERSDAKPGNAAFDGRHLRNLRWEGESLLLGFDTKLGPREVNFFKLFDRKTQRYRYVFDIHALLTKREYGLDNGGLKRIDLSQYRADTMRLVLESDTKLDLHFKQVGRELVIDPGVVKRARTSESPKLSVSQRAHLRNVRWQDGSLVLRFDQKLAPEQVAFTKLLNTAAKRYRYIFNIENSMLNKRHDLRHKEVRSIRLAQFDSKTLRLVVENDTELGVSYAIRGKELTIDLGVGAVVHPDSTVAPVRGGGIDKVIVLDPGHGGKDTGAIGYKGYREKSVVLQITKELSKILKEQGYKVYMTRSGDRFIKLRNRTNYANAKDADLFVSIHANAVPKQNAKKAYGIETYFLSNDDKAGSERAKRVAAMENSKDLQDVTFYGQQDFINILNREKIKMSERLAYDLQRNVLAELRKSYKNVKDGGVREGPFWILVEVGFITHPEEAKRLVSRSYQKRFARGLANGITQYFIHNP